MLNSFWGKFGENINKPAVTAVDSPTGLFQMVSDTLNPVQTIWICNEDRLYKSLEKLGEQVLYYDMDSVIYKCKPGQTTIPLGDYLGDMTDELEGKGYITEFVSGGPKN